MKTSIKRISTLTVFLILIGVFVAYQSGYISLTESQDAVAKEDTTQLEITDTSVLRPELFSTSKSIIAIDPEVKSLLADSLSKLFKDAITRDSTKD